MKTNICTHDYSSIRKRMLFFLTTAIIFCLSLTIRLFFLQVISYKDLVKKASKQWYRDLPIKAPRGNIYSSDNVVLADNEEVYTIYIRPRAVTDAYEVAKTISFYFNDLDEQKLIESIRQANVSEITVKRNVSTNIANQIKARHFKGVYFTLDSKRSYPNSQYLTQVLGFTNIDNVGQNGIEGYYDKYLKGVNGFVYTPADIKGKEIEGQKTYLPAIRGIDLTLSINSHMQKFAEEAVQNATLEWKAKGAEMLVYDIQTGGILANALAPSYNLNEPPRNEIELLDALSKNKLICDVYEPGSTFKIITTAAALAEGLVKPTDKFFCPGYRIIDGQRIKCWKTIGHGSETFVEVVKNSCNCVFMDLAQRLGVKKMYEYMRKFGFGTKSGIDFFGEGKGILLNENKVKLVDLVRIGFGQTIACTPLQLARATAAIVNNGYLCQPYYLEKATAKNNQVIYTHSVQKEKVLDSNTSETMKQLLLNVVENGGGRYAKVDGYNIGGKTGTAQKYVNGHIAQGKYISSFIGFAPYENPRYLILMTIDEPGTYVYYGSLTAAPYVGQVYKKIFEYLNLPKSNNEITVKDIEMPDLIGKPLSEAIIILKKLGLKYELAGDDGIVEAEMPKKGSLLSKGDLVLLKTYED